MTLTAEQYEINQNEQILAEKNPTIVEKWNWEQQETHNVTMAWQRECNTKWKSERMQQCIVNIVFR